MYPSGDCHVVLRPWKDLSHSSQRHCILPLTVASEIGLIPVTLCADLAAEGEEIEKMLNGYIAFLKASKRGVKEPGADRSVREDLSPYDIEPWNPDDLTP